MSLQYHTEGIAYQYHFHPGITDLSGEGSVIGR